MKHNANDLESQLMQAALSSSWLKERDNRMRSEGWKHRDNEVGTRYEIGNWVDLEDVEEDEEDNKLVRVGDWGWRLIRHAHSASDAQNTAYRWGCDYREVRINPWEQPF